jgi:hypothetical protein
MLKLFIYSRLKSTSNICSHSFSICHSKINYVLKIDQKQFSVFMSTTLSHGVNCGQEKVLFQPVLTLLSGFIHIVTDFCQFKLEWM